jgi:hypothetical protein
VLLLLLLLLYQRVMFKTDMLDRWFLQNKYPPK